MSRNDGPPRTKGKEQIARCVVPLAAHKLEEQIFSSEMLSQHAGTFMAVWSHMNPVEVTGVRATAKEFNDAKKCGPHAQLLSFPLRHMRREIEPIEPEHASIESPIFAFPFTRLADVRLLAGNDPLSPEALEGLPWHCEWPQWPEAGPASFARAGPARTGTFLA